MSGDAAVLLVEPSSLRRLEYSRAVASMTDAAVVAVRDAASAVDAMAERPAAWVVVNPEVPGASATTLVRSLALLGGPSKVVGVDTRHGSRAFDLGPGLRSIRVAPADFAGHPEVTRYLASPPTPAFRPALLPRRVACVVVAASTGGPEAMRTVLGRLDETRTAPPPVILVQHTRGTRVDELVADLRRHSSLDVAVADEGSILTPGRLLVAAGGRHVVLRRLDRHRLEVACDDGPPVDHLRPAADVLFRSAAEVVGRDALAVVLTGMGRDGARGARRIADAGGYVIAQSAGSSTVYGMPRATVEEGAATAVLPLEQIADIVATAG